MGTHTKLTLDDYAMTLIRLKARQLIGRYGFNRSDREDIEQELTLDLLTRLDRFDPRQGRPATFVQMVVNRHVASLIRQRRSVAHDYRRAMVSLDELSDETGDDNGTEPAFDDRDQRDLAIDVNDAVDALPDHLRSVADDLRVQTIAEVARERRCHREAMRGTTTRIRCHFRGRGLDDYKSSHHIVNASRM